MKEREFTFNSKEGTLIHTYCWAPEADKPKAIVQICHGMVETAARYRRLADKLTGQGFIVYANDQRGHGKTAGSPEQVGYLADRDGFEWLVRDAHQLTEIAKKENPGLPVFLLGHSMGSFEAQRYIQLYGRELSGTILSGSNGPSAMFGLGKIMARRELKRIGPKARSEKMNQLSFGSYNNKFKPARTPFDWLSRDPAEVDKYIADPYCGTVCTAQFYYDFMDGLSKLFRKTELANVPPELPLLIISGSLDPVGNNGKGVKKLYRVYQGLGLRDVRMKLYEGARHEILNETNRDEVMNDISSWLASQLTKEA